MVLSNFGAKLMPTQEAADSCTKLKYEAASIEPPYAPYTTELMEEPLTPYSAGLKRAVEADFSVQGESGAKQRHPPAKHLARSQLRAIVAGEIAGAHGRSGVFGARLKKMAEVLEVAPRTNQEPLA